MRTAISASRRNRPSAYLVGILASFAGMTMEPAAAQDDLLRPGEAFATHFSGTSSDKGPDVDHDRHD